MSKATKTKSNKLTSTKINQLEKSLDERTTIYVGSQSYEIQIDKTLRKSKIQLLLTEWLVQLEQLKKVTNLDIDLVRDVALLETGLFLKHFTDLPIHNDPLKMVNQVITLMDYDLVEEIENKFDSSEIEKYQRITKKVLENVKQYGEGFSDIVITDILKTTNVDESSEEVDMNATV